MANQRASSISVAWKYRTEARSGFPPALSTSGCRAIDNHAMPIYEFRCADCGKVTNHFTRKVDTELKVACEHCKSAKTSRLMSKFGRTYSRADIIDRYGIRRWA